MDELIKNLRMHLVDALSYLGSFESQQRYKKAVPFVHVPVELHEQMNQFSPHRSSSLWYAHVIPNSHVRGSLLTLDEALERHFKTCPRRCSDVPAVFERQSWINVRDASQAVIVQLYQTPEYQDTLASYW